MRGAELRHSEAEETMPDNLFWRNASGRLILSMYSVPADSYKTVRTDRKQPVEGVGLKY
jgi:hypothetical protein